MLLVQLSVKTEKSQKYFKSLCKHFSRKVEVTYLDESCARITFHSGQCLIQVDGERMLFDVSASDNQSLEKVKFIVSSHIVLFRELKNMIVIWSKP